MAGPAWPRQSDHRSVSQPSMSSSPIGVTTHPGQTALARCPTTVVDGERPGRPIRPAFDVSYATSVSPKRGRCRWTPARSTRHPLDQHEGARARPAAGRLTSRVRCQRSSSSRRGPPSPPRSIPRWPRRCPARRRRDAAATASSAWIASLVSPATAAADLVGHRVDRFGGDRSRPPSPLRRRTAVGRRTDPGAAPLISATLPASRMAGVCCTSIRVRRPLRPDLRHDASRRLPCA